MSKRKGSKKRKGAPSLRSLILNLFAKNPSLSLNHKQVSSRLSLSSESDRKKVKETLDSLKSSEELVEIQPGKYKLKSVQTYVTGTVDMTHSGAAYVVSDETEKDIYVNNRNTNHALHGDTVKVYVIARKRDGKLTGEIVEILQRKRTEFVGTMDINGGVSFMIPNSGRVPVDFFIPPGQTLNAQHGEKVLVKMKEWRKQAKNPVGEVVKVLGAPGENETEIHAILAEYGLPHEFPAEVEAFAENLDVSIPEKEVKKRLDLRDVLTFTIDPHDAKDFDDALSFEVLRDGKYRIGIHIADVSHYLLPDTPLDEEAYARATSVYLVDRVVPMLPEMLSNKVCSLRPNEEKLTFSAIFEMDESGKVYSEWFGRTVINSNRRFTYEEAQEVIENQKGDLEEAILPLDRMAKNLRAKRIKNGALIFDREEVKFILDNKGHPVNVYFKRSKDANKLIEEFMLLANRKVAEFIGKSKGGKPSNNTFVYRIHDSPDPEKLKNLGLFVSQFGYQVHLGNQKVISESLNKMLKEVVGKKEESMVEQLTLRSMSKAIYSTENIGHYGLAFEDYTHFTSPIRRYPDVMVHRLLQHYLDGGNSPKSEPYEQRCKHSSEREKLATDAERDSIKFMQVKFMQSQVGTVFDGFISGVTEFGLFVTLETNHCEGLIRISDIDDDFYVYDESSYCFRGMRNKKEHQLGDQVRVRVKRADLEKKQLDFSFADQDEA